MPVGRLGGGEQLARKKGPVNGARASETCWRPLEAVCSL